MVELKQLIDATVDVQKPSAAKCDSLCKVFRKGYFSVVHFSIHKKSSEQPCRTPHHALEIRLSAVVGAKGFVQGTLTQTSTHTHARTSFPEVTAIIGGQKGGNDSNLKSSDGKVAFKEEP